MPPRRPPPGGYSTFAFGNADELKEAQSRATPSPDKTIGTFNSGISPAQVEVIRGLLGSSENVEVLIEKMQSELLGGPVAGGDLNGSSRPRGSIATRKVNAASEALRAAFAQRGTDTLVRLGKKFRIMDDDSSNGLSYEEFKKGLMESGVRLSEEHLQALFRSFDTDCSGYINFDEFMMGVRPQMSEKRCALVLQAFKAMDTNGDGALTVQDVSGYYDCSLHPEVVSGARTEVEVLQSFLAGFDGSLGQKSAVVTPEKFLAHYQNVSASVDDDEYFALIMRNTWHMKGPEGESCGRRLLVTHEDGTQSIEEVDNDFEISKEDLQEIKAKLREQGVPVVKVALYGYVEASGGNILSSSMSPKRGSPVPPSSRQQSNAGEAEEPEKVVAAYKQRMSTSNVSFA